LENHLFLIYVYDHEAAINVGGKHEPVAIGVGWLQEDLPEAQTVRSEDIRNFFGVQIDLFEFSDTYLGDGKFVIFLKLKTSYFTFELG